MALIITRVGDSGGVIVKDNKNRDKDAPALIFDARTWTAFGNQAKAGRLTLDGVVGNLSYNAREKDVRLSDGNETIVTDESTFNVFMRKVEKGETDGATD